MNSKYIKLGDIIKNKRESHKFSQAKLGMLTGISEAEISRIESGKRKIPTMPNLINLCEVLQIDMRDVLKIIGLYEKNTKKYTLFLTKTEKKQVNINAENEEEVINIIENYLLENPYIFDETGEFMDVEIEEQQDEPFVRNIETDNKKCEFCCPYCES